MIHHALLHETFCINRTYKQKKSQKFIAFLGSVRMFKQTLLSCTVSLKSDSHSAFCNQISSSKNCVNERPSQKWCLQIFYPDNQSLLKSGIFIKAVISPSNRDVFLLFDMNETKMRLAAFWEPFPAIKSRGDSFSLRELFYGQIVQEKLFTL